MNAQSFLSPRLGLGVLGLAIAISCNQADDSDGPIDGSGGAGTGGAGKGTGGSATGGAEPGTGGIGGEGGSCVPKLYGVQALCHADWFGGTFIDATVPDDPLHDPAYVCTSKRPKASYADGKTALFRLRQGCGLADWFLDEPGTPNQGIVWDLETENLVGCRYEDDYPHADQCGGFTLYAGQRFECDTFEQKYCLFHDDSSGGAGGEGGAI